MRLVSLIPALLLQAGGAAAAPQPLGSVIVSYVELSSYTITGRTITLGSAAYTITPETITSRIPVTPKAATPTGLSTTTYTDYYYSKTIVEIVLPTGAGDKILPTSTSSTYSSSGSYDDTTSSSSSAWDDYLKRRNRDLNTRIIIIAAVAGAGVLLLIAGIFLQSYKYFAAMMCGQERKRGVPLRWCFCIHFTVPCAGPRWKARDAEDQRVLTEKWNALSVGARVGLWLKWGFKWKYPVELLGEEPDRLNKSWRKKEVVETTPEPEVVQVDGGGKERV